MHTFENTRGNLQIIFYFLNAVFDFIQIDGGSQFGFCYIFTKENNIHARVDHAPLCHALSYSVSDVFTLPTLIFHNTSIS